MKVATTNQVEASGRGEKGEAGSWQPTRGGGGVAGNYYVRRGQKSRTNLGSDWKRKYNYLDRGARKKR